MKTHFLDLLNRLFIHRLIDQVLLPDVFIDASLIEGRDFRAVIDDPRVPIKVLLPRLLALILIYEHKFLALTLIGVDRLEWEGMTALLWMLRAEETVVVFHENLVYPGLGLKTRWPGLGCFHLPEDDFWSESVLPHGCLECLSLLLLLLLFEGRLDTLHQLSVR